MANDDESLSDYDLDLLANAQLEFFRAEPSQIQPFRESTLTWRVGGLTPPAGKTRRAHVELNGKTVAAIGTQAVSPSFTKTWALRVTVGQLTRLLGQVTVRVDLDACTTQLYPEVATNVDAELRKMVTTSEKPELKFQTRHELLGPGNVVSKVIYPEVEVSELGIEFKLALEVILPGENPTLDIDAAFSFAVVYDGDVTSRRLGRLVPVFRRLKAVADFDQSWLIPTAIIGIPALIGSIQENAEEKVRANVQGTADDLTARVRAAARKKSEGLRMHSIRFTTPTQTGWIEVTVCPVRLTIDTEGVVPV